MRTNSTFFNPFIVMKDKVFISLDLCRQHRYNLFCRNVTFACTIECNLMPYRYRETYCAPAQAAPARVISSLKMPPAPARLITLFALANLSLVRGKLIAVIGCCELLSCHARQCIV